MIISEFSFTLQDKELSEEKIVKIPHTWNIDNETASFQGSAKYTSRFEINKADTIILRAKSVFLVCRIYVNNNFVCEHRSGYTQFDTDITDYCVKDENELKIIVDNSFSENTLPYKNHYDWNCDGGILRDLEILEISSDQIYQAQIQYDITNWSNDNTVCSCDFHIKYYSKKYSSKKADVIVTNFRTNETVYSGQHILDGKDLMFSIDNLLAWNTQNPNLYMLYIKCDNWEYSARFGVRKISAENNAVYLNNEKIRLLAVEYLPGSNPAYGMAEPFEEIEKNLILLKNADCNFTRFHWQQDSRLFDWCDENGLMVQEEIPFWGFPKNAEDKQLEAAKEQADEMLESHFNHPSIVCWGVGNELDGYSPATCDYVGKMISYFKFRDSSRLVNYVSNTLGKTSLFLKNKIYGLYDATTLGDICMWNEYTGTWQPTLNFKKVFRYAKKPCGSKPLVVTEFGLCEPKFKGGDKKRIAIYNKKLKLYRKMNFAGWVYFSLNDYRTHMGEAGDGPVKQRIHGSVDLYGNLKPSYKFICNQNNKDKMI